MKLVCFIAGHMVENDWEGNILFSADSISPTKGKDNLKSRIEVCLTQGIAIMYLLNDFH